MKRKFSLVYSLLLGTIATTTLAGCGSVEVEKKFSVELNFDESLGSVTADKKEGVLSADTSVTLTISPKEGYKIKTVKINGTEVIAKETITFSPKENSNTVDVTFEPDVQIKKFTVKLAYDTVQGYVLSPVQSGDLEKYKKIDLTILPSKGYEIDTVKQNGVDIEPVEGKYSFVPVEGENLIAVTFKLIPVETEFSVVAEYDDARGTVEIDTPNGIVEETEKVNVTIKAKEGFEIGSIFVNNVPEVQVKENISFKPIAGENVIKVLFVEVVVETTFTVKTEFDNTQGDVEVSATSGIVENTDSVTVTILPKKGFVTSNISVNGKAEETIKTIVTFKPIAGENIIKVTFTPEEVKNNFSVVVEAPNPAEGTLVSDIKEGVIEDSTVVTVTATPSEGYRIDEIFVNGISSKVVDNKVSFKPVIGENRVKATFAKLPVKTAFEVETTFNAEGGNVLVANKTGYLEDLKTTNVAIVAKSGYEVSEVKINGENRVITEEEKAGITFDLNLIAGKNTIEVIFIKKPVAEYFSITIVKPDYGNVNVTLDKTTGVVGEDVTFTVTLNEDRFEIEDILLNGQRIKKETRKFTPIAGNNTLEIKITNKKTPPAIDLGQKFDEIVRTEDTDLTSASEAIDLVFNKINSQIENEGSTDKAYKIFTAYAKHFDLYEEVFVKYGITKADIDSFYNVIVTPEFVEILNSNLTGSELNNKLLKQFYRVLADLFKGDYAVDKFVGLTSTAMFAAVVMVYGEEYGYKLVNQYDLINDNMAGKQASEMINASKPAKEELRRLFGAYEVVGQLLYITINSTTKPVSANVLEMVFNLFGNLFSGSSSVNDIFGGQIKEDELYEIVNLFDDVLNNHFLSKTEFYKFVDKLHSYGDVLHLHLKLFAYTKMGENQYVTNTYKYIVDAIYNNKDQAYYLIKFVGLYCRELNRQDITNILYVFNNSSSFGAKEFAQLLIIAANHFDGVKTSYQLSADAVKAINAMGSLITKIIIAARNGVLPETLPSTINFESIVNKLEEIKNYKFDLPSDAELVKPFAQSIIDSVPSNEKVDNVYNHKMALKVEKETYIIGETKFAVTATYDGQDVTNQLAIENFSTKDEGQFVAKISYKDYVFFRTYTVSRAGVSVIEHPNDTITKVALNSDPAQFNRTFKFTDNAEKLFSEFDKVMRSKIDTSTKGLKTGWVNYYGTYFFFSYEVI